MRLRPLLEGAARRAARSMRRWVAEPVECPAGWVTAAPDFVGVGAQRSGTQWWYGLVTDHPRANATSAAARRLGPRERPDASASIPTIPQAPIVRELHFFDSFAERELSVHDSALYHRFFPRPPGELSGEWTPRYMLDFWTPRLVRRAAPKARLLVLLRDPVERLRSGMSILLPAARARGTPLAWNLLNDAVLRSLYAPQLARLLEHFPREQLLVLQYERCTLDPATEIRRTYEFLGLEADHVPARLRAQAGPARPKPEFPEAVREDLVAALAADVRELVARFPEIDPELWPSFRDAL